MNSCTTRLALARWCNPPFKLLRRSDLSSVANNPSAPSKCASATPPKPPPKRQRNSRRSTVLRREGVALALCLIISINKTEFAAIEKDAAGAGQVVLARIGGQAGGCLGRGIPGQSKAISRFDLALPVRADLLKARGKMRGLADHKRVVQSGERLQGRKGGIALGHEQGGIGAIQAIHERIRHTANQVPVNTASIRAGAVRIEAGVIVNRGMIALVVELPRGRTAHHEIEFAAHKQDGVAHRFGIEPR